LGGADNSDDAMLPFTEGQFLGVFAKYNAALWPAAFAAFLLGALAVYCLLRRPNASGRVISACLAAMWIWTGGAYHWIFFSPINSAAYLFGALFIIQGLAFLIWGGLLRYMTFELRPDAASFTGMGFIVYSAIVYPIIGLSSGFELAELPAFGVTPCPVTIFTFGVLLLAKPPAPLLLLTIPLLWSMIGGSAAFLLGVPQDWLLLGSGLVTLSLAIMRRGAPKSVQR
jgi:hypothetical protein